MRRCVVNSKSELLGTASTQEFLVTIRNLDPVNPTGSRKWKGEFGNRSFQHAVIFSKWTQGNSMLAPFIAVHHIPRTNLPKMKLSSWKHESDI